MTRLTPLLVSALLAFTSAQSLGKSKEVHPKLDTYECTLKHGCKKQKTAIVLDALAHPVHQKDHPELDCGSWGNKPNATVCPDKETCAKNCIVEGVSDYSAYGVYTKGDSMRLTMLNEAGKVVTPRVYLLDKSENKYEMMKLTGKEFTFDIKGSKLPCGMNAALYLSEMEKDGGKSKLNKGGAAIGSGYCDAQCYTTPFINGEANIEGKGACCPELDIWEGNSRATHLAPHPCNITSLYEGTGEENAFEGVCDEWGCGQNPYAIGNKGFYGAGPEFTINTLRDFTVITQFVANKKGELDEIRRRYIQDGKYIESPTVKVPGRPEVSIMDDEYCAATGGARRFEELGGMPEMGDALSRGMVLCFAIWWDEGGFMSWLDGGDVGPCVGDEGKPSNILKVEANPEVTFENIRWGEIGSTFKQPKPVLPGKPGSGKPGNPGHGH